MVTERIESQEPVLRLTLTPRDVVASEAERLEIVVSHSAEPDAATPPESAGEGEPTSEDAEWQ